MREISAADRLREIALCLVKCGQKVDGTALEAQFRYETGEDAESRLVSSVLERYNKHNGKASDTDRNEAAEAPQRSGDELSEPSNHVRGSTREDAAPHRSARNDPHRGSKRKRDMGEEGNGAKVEADELAGESQATQTTCKRKDRRRGR